jgi:hypothetical protein
MPCGGTVNFARFKTSGIFALAGVVFAGCSAGGSTIVPAALMRNADSASAVGNGDAASPIKAVPATIALLGTGSISEKRVTVTEKGYAGEFTLESTCKGIATAAPTLGKGPIFRVTVTGKAAGSCAMTITDGKKHAVTLPVTDTTTSIALSALSISPQSASVTVTVVSVDGKKPSKKLQTTVTNALPKCGNGCTIAGPQAPAGTDVFSLTTFDAANGQGNQLATGTTSFKIVAGRNNSVPAALGKIPKFLSFGTIPSATAGTAFTTPQPLALTVQDADHTTIVGPYSTPITMSDSDTSPASLGSALVLDGDGNSRSVKLANSSDKVALAYGGLAIAPVTLAASATGASGTSAQFAPSLLPIAYTGPKDDGTPEIDLYNPDSGQPGYSGSFTLSQAGWSGNPFNNDFTYALGGKNNNCSSFTVSPNSGSAAAYTVALDSSPVAGTCVLTITGASSATTQNVVLTYTSNSIGVSSKRRR